jgi:hypothetical protein
LLLDLVAAPQLPLERDVSTNPSHTSSSQLPEGTVLSDALSATTFELCQLRWIDDAVSELNWFERVLRYANGKRLGLIRRSRMAMSRVSFVEPQPYGGRADWVELDDGTSAPIPPKKLVPIGLRAGDVVEVLSSAEIEALLDADGKTGGLKFLRPMEDYCGRRMRVLKPVRRILDEHDHVMRKIARTVVLEGGICHGRGIYGREGCDRCCYFFWKEDWLKKASE